MIDRLDTFSRRTILKGLLYGSAGVGAAVLVGCGNDGFKRNEAKQKSILEARGLTGQHDLVDLRDVPGFQLKGEIDGGFLSFDGAIEGQSKRFLEFAWKTNSNEPEIIVSQVPLDVVKFKEIEDATNPSVEFRFDMIKIIKPGGCDSWNTDCGKTVDSDVPNNFIKDGNVNLVQITMTPEQFKSFRSAR